MHYNFCFSQVLSIIGNEKVPGKKVNCYGRSDTETILVDQTCSTANAPFSSCSQPRRTCVLCTDSLTRTQNAISQLKCLCHLVSCLNLISFFLYVGGGKSRWMQRERRRGCIEKKRWLVNWGEAHWSQRQSRGPTKTPPTSRLSTSMTLLCFI